MPAAHQCTVYMETAKNRLCSDSRTSGVWVMMWNPLVELLT